MVPMDTKLGRMVAYLVGLLTIQSFSVVLQGHGTNDKHLPYQSACSQTWQDDNLSSWAAAYNVT